MIDWIATTFAIGFAGEIVRPVEEARNKTDELIRMRNGTKKRFIFRTVQSSDITNN